MCAVLAPLCPCAPCSRRLSLFFCRARCLALSLFLLACASPHIWPTLSPSHSCALALSRLISRARTLARTRTHTRSHAWDRGAGARSRRRRLWAFGAAWSLWPRTTSCSRHVQRPEHAHARTRIANGWCIRSLRFPGPLGSRSASGTHTRVSGPRSIGRRSTWASTRSRPRTGPAMPTRRPHRRPPPSAPAPCAWPCQ